MTLKEIMEKCSTLVIDEKRCVNDEYIEIVFYNREMDAWNEMFTDILGSAVKPAGTKPSKDDLSLTENHGGIHKDQTLFKKEFDNSAVMAMFWPWQDDTHTTLKVVLLK